MATQAPKTETSKELPPRRGRAPLSLVGAVLDAHTESDPTKPTRGVHPAAIVMATTAAAWFVFAITVGFTGSGDGSYVLAIVVAFSVIFFGLVLGTAARAGSDPRWGDRPARFHDFVEDNVSVATGIVSGREAMIQMLMLPVTLAIGATAIAVVYWIASNG